MIAHLPLTGVAKAPEVNISGELKKFAINLAGSELWFLTIAFESFNLKSVNGGPPQFEVQIDSVEFGDCLSFIKDLAKALDPSEGPFLEFLGVKIQAGFRFQLPNIAVGAFAMRDLRIFVEAAISLVGEPMRVRIGISDRQRPFLIQMGIFGGGGFFAMELGLDGVQAMEGALEFGVTASISIGGVANGFGYIMAGIYYSIEKIAAGNGATRDQTKLCGFVRAGGHLSIIGLISMNLDIYVDLCYIRDGGNNLVRGSAEVDIEIDIFFFSVTVTIHADYTFSGSDDGQRTLQEFESRKLPEARGLLEALHQVQFDLDSEDDWRQFREYFVPIVPLQV